MKVLLTEKQFRILKENNVNSILRQYSKKIQSEGVGYAGQLTSAGFYNKEQLVDDIEQIQQYDWDYEDNYENEADYSPPNNFVFKIWKNYSDAMGRNRDGSQLPLANFCNYLLNDSVFLYEKNDSFIIGQYSNGFFKPSHFAPLNIRAGVDIVRDIIKYDNIVFTVTEDLKEMLSKLGAYSDKKLIFPMIFREMAVEKHLVLTNPNIMAKVLYELEYGDINSLLDLNYFDMNVTANNDKYADYDELYSDHR
jgi:hypothetical protein